MRRSLTAIREELTKPFLVSVQYLYATTYPTRHTHSPPVRPAYAWRTETTPTNRMSIQCRYPCILVLKTIHNTAQILASGHASQRNQLLPVLNLVILLLSSIIYG